MNTVTTLVIIHNDENILLGLKKRGFGSGRWNGYGGKVLEGETVEEAAWRELKEEASIVQGNLIPRGQIIFTFENNPDWGTGVEVNLFALEGFDGYVEESEEMKPQWFAHQEIPYNEMWVDDQYWLPLFLEGKNIRGHFHFDNPGSQNILHHNLEGYEA